MGECLGYLDTRITTNDTSGCPKLYRAGAQAGALELVTIAVVHSEAQANSSCGSSGDQNPHVLT